MVVKAIGELMSEPTNRRPHIKHKAKRYRAYLLESKDHYISIMEKYGMPTKAHPPELSEDIIERVARDRRMSWKTGDWSIK